VEQQATDRTHRLGQTKHVFVYKLIAVGTVEEKILALQQRKKVLMDGVFSEQNQQGANLTLDDLKHLFS
jgi:SNF2 family DNA or RNA helicase